MLISDGEIVYGAFEKPPEVVDIPAGWAFARLRLRNTDIARLYLRNGASFSCWYVGYADETKTKWPIALNIR